MDQGVHSQSARRRLQGMLLQLSQQSASSHFVVVTGPLSGSDASARAENDGRYGADEGFPAWNSLADLHLDHIALSNKTRGCPVVAKYRVGNFVNTPGQGFEAVFPHNVLHADASTTAPLVTALKPDFSYEFNGKRRTPQDYLDTWPITGLFIGRSENVWLEEYRYERDGDMFFTSWSMAKSVTSLLLGICIDRGLIKSLDDTPEMYLPSLKGTYHGSVTLRNLSNMSSGVDVVHGRDNPSIYPRAHWGPGSDIVATVAGWNAPREQQGSLFNYTELCPLVIGATLRAATVCPCMRFQSQRQFSPAVASTSTDWFVLTLRHFSVLTIRLKRSIVVRQGMTLSAFAEEVLWQPMGAEADATWCTDSHGAEFNCVNFQCRLRDWAR